MRYPRPRGLRVTKPPMLCFALVFRHPVFCELLPYQCALGRQYSAAFRYPILPSLNCLLRELFFDLLYLRLAVSKNHPLKASITGGNHSLQASSMRDPISPSTVLSTSSQEMVNCALPQQTQPSLLSSVSFTYQ